MKNLDSTLDRPSLRAELESVLDGLEHHPVFANPYFELLRQGRWDAASYELHRANFFYRTELTVKAIAHVCSRAAAQEDQDTLILFAYILDEECGKGRREACHAKLMEDSHNLFGAAEFGLAPLAVKAAKGHPGIIAETQEYRDRLNGLITGSYHHMLGVVMALESHADKMLRACREAFRNARRVMEPAAYRSKVEVYFNCHLENGLEERHAADAKTCVANNVRCAEDLIEIRYGAEEALKAQARMWDALSRRAKGR